MHQSCLSLLLFGSSFRARCQRPLPALPAFASPLPSFCRGPVTGASLFSILQQRPLKISAKLQEASQLEHCHTLAIFRVVRTRGARSSDLLTTLYLCLL